MGIFSPDSELMEFLGKVTDYIIINLLTLFLSIPIITMGAAHTAKFYTSMNSFSLHELLKRFLAKGPHNERHV